jgi:nitrite reductase/ring-hydroxylating ferredoxin subunit
VSAEERVGAVVDLPPGTVIGVGHYAVGNVGGRYFAVTRRCRHLGADLAGGRIDDGGCLVCPWHHAAYDVSSGRMVRGPQGVFAKVPGLDWGYRMLTRMLPLGRATVVDRDGDLYLRH